MKSATFRAWVKTGCLNKIFLVTWGELKNINTIELAEIKTLLVEMIMEEVETIETLSASKKQRFAEIILKHKQLFNKELGFIKLYQHKLKFFICRKYPVSTALHKRVGNEIESLMKAGKVRHSNRTDINPLVIVTKKNCDIHLCLDASKLNNIFIDDYECFDTDVSHSSSNNFQICQDSKFVEMSVVGTARTETPKEDIYLKRKKVPRLLRAQFIVREMIFRSQTPFISSNYLRQQLEIEKLEQVTMRRGFSYSLIIPLSV